VTIEVRKADRTEACEMDIISEKNEEKEQEMKTREAYTMRVPTIDFILLLLQLRVPFFRIPFRLASPPSPSPPSFDHYAKPSYPPQPPSSDLPHQH
jgi:hypothetical protein